MADHSLVPEKKAVPSPSHGCIPCLPPNSGSTQPRQTLHRVDAQGHTFRGAGEEARALARGGGVKGSKQGGNPGRRQGRRQGRTDKAQRAKGDPLQGLDPLPPPLPGGDDSCHAYPGAALGFQVPIPTRLRHLWLGGRSGSTQESPDSADDGAWFLLSHVTAGQPGGQTGAGTGNRFRANASSSREAAEESRRKTSMTAVAVSTRRGEACTHEPGNASTLRLPDFATRSPQKCKRLDIT
ncbi:unnamed protein product [Diplocarpon coronariae]